MNTSYVISQCDQQAKKQREIALLRNKIMDLRDNRIRIQRKINELQGILFWEPYNFTKAQQLQLEKLTLKAAKLYKQEKTIHNYIYN